MPRTEEHEEDLFKDSTMSFGEHLEELRKSLFRAVVWLVAGVSIGLGVANRVVEYVQTPLQGALKRYIQYEDEQTADLKIKEMREQGDPVTDEGYMRERIKQGLLPQMILVDRDQLLKVLGLSPAASSPAPEAAARPPAADSPPAGDAAPVSEPNLVSVFTYHKAVDDPRIRARSLSTGEPFTIWLKAALLVGAILASPMVFYELWMFVAAGLYPHEKKYIHIYLPFSVGLFFSGAALAFLFALQPVLDFLLSFNRWMGITPDLRITEWLSFVLLLPLGFGISFQLPLVMLFLERIGIFTIKSYISRWRVSVLAIFVLAMVCTPGDPYSMLLMAVTLTFLYFGGILLCRLMPGHKSKFEDLDEEYV